MRATRIPTTIIIPWVPMELHMHPVSMPLLQILSLQLQSQMDSLRLCLEWKTRPPPTHLNHLPLPLPSPPCPLPPQRNPPFPLPLFLPHLTLSTPSLHHKTLTVPVTPCHIHLGITTSCRLTVMPKVDPTTGRRSRDRTLISPRKTVSNQASFYKGLEEERATKTKNKDSNYGTA